MFLSHLRKNNPKRKRVTPKKRKGVGALGIAIALLVMMMMRSLLTPRSLRARGCARA